MTRIWERLWLGSFLDAQQLAKANPHGITTVVSLCEAGVRPTSRSVNYIHVHVEDAKPLSIRKFDSIINAIAQNIFRGTVLVKCGEGISRAPTLTAAYMHLVGYEKFESCLAEIQQLPPIVSPSDILLDSIEEHLR